MATEVKVSIVVPVCNVERYLKECMDSILAQTLKEIEIICVDDGSKDNSLKILKEYEAKDSRVIVITKPNSGYGNTMNVGMAKAKGEYIGIVESDDYVKPDMFEKLYNKAKETNAEVVKSDHYIFSTKNGKAESEFQAICPEWFYNKVLNAEVCPEVFNFAMMNWTGVYLRSFIEENKIVHNETPGASFQDNGFWFKVFTSAKKMVFINEAFYYYRQDNPNSSINDKKKVFTICEEYKYIQNYVTSDPRKAELFFSTFFTKKVFNYLHTYNRLLQEHKIKFLERAASDFSEDLKNPYFKPDEMDPWILEQVNRIIDSPELFYIEDSSYVLYRKYDEVHAKLMEIRNSKEFQKGLKLKKMLHAK